MSNYNTTDSATSLVNKSLRKRASLARGIAALFVGGGFLALGMLTSAQAANLTWDANAATANQTDGAGAWLGADQWWNGTTNVTWSDNNNANFGSGGVGAAVTLASPIIVDSLNLNIYTGTYTLGTAGQTITLNSGITRAGYAGTQTSLISPITMGANQTWSNNTFNGAATQATGSLSATGGLDNGGFTLTIDGVGTTNFGGTANIITGAGGLTKNGIGTLILSGAGTTPIHTYSGTTTINGGVVRFQNVANATGTGNLTINSGVLEGYFGNAGTYQRNLGAGAGEIQILGGTSGFSGQGSTSSNFTIGTAGDTLVWGSTFFNPAVLVLQASTVNANGKLTLNNGIDLNGASRTIGSFGGDTTGGGTVTGAVIDSLASGAGLTKIGIGNLILTGANAYTGSTTVNGNNVFTGASTTTNAAGGTLTLSGSGTLNSTSAFNLNVGGVLRLVNAAQVDRAADGVAITVNNGGGITYENTSGANIYTETVGATTVNSGQFNVNLAINQAGAGSQTLTFNTGGLTRNGTAAVTFSAAGTGPQATGNKNMIFVTGAGTTTVGQVIGPWATTGTAVNAQTDYAIYNADFVTPAGIAASAQSGWSTTHALDSNYTMSALAAGTLSASRNINSLRSTNNSVTVTASDANIALASHTLAVDDVVTFSATTMPTGLAAGTPYFVVATGAGTIQVSATQGGAAITPTTAGNAVVAAGGIRLSTGNNLGTTGILNGTATRLNILTSGTGAVTLPTSGAGQLHINAGSGSITNNAPIIDNGGALTLVKSGSGGSITMGNITTQGVLVLNGVNEYTGNTIINGGTLQVGTNAVANGAKLGGASGNYAGNIAINAGAMLHITTDAAQTLSGVISGDGALMKSFTGTLTLSGNNTYTGRTSIAPITTAGAGILEVSSFNSVVGGTPSSSLGAPTTVFNGTIDLGGPLNIQGPATLRYIGTGETTDRVVNVFHGATTTRNIDASGLGLLKFTSAFTSTGGTLAGSNIQLIGTGTGEIVQGLPFLVNNFTKSGTGTWTLGGPIGSTSAATTTIANGMLVVTNPVRTFGSNPSGTNIQGAGTLSLRNDSSVTFNNGNTAYNIANSASGSTINVDRVTGTGSNTITVGNLTTGSVAGSWTQNFTGANGVSLNAGTLTTPLATATTTHTINNNIATTNGATLTLASIVEPATFATPVLNFDGTGRTNVTGAITQTTSALALTKNGAGTVALGGANTYLGTTSVIAGKLLLNGNNTAATGAVSVSPLATLGGNGTVGGLTTVAGTGIVAPGNSAGNLTFAAGLDLSAGGVYSWELGALSVVNPGMDFDTITVSGGNLALGGTSALTLDFGLVSANDPNSVNAFWTTGKSWKIIDVTTGTNTGDTNLSTITNASYSSGSFTTTVGGVGPDLGDIFLVFTPGVMGPPQWIGTGDWSNSANWQGGVPNSASAVASFLGMGTGTVTVDSPQTVNQVVFNAASPSYTIGGASTLSLAGTTPTITNTIGSNTISAPLNLGNGTTVTVSAGTLSLNASSNSVLGTGVTATVATGATLNLGGAGNALSNGTTTHANVANNGTLAATTAGKRVGNITGTGTTNVTAASATLTATSIRQSVLSIGATSQVNLTPSLGNKPAGISVFTNTAGTSLSIATGGNFDTNDNDLIVYYQAGQGATTLATIQQQIIDGFLNTPAVAKISSSTGAVDMDKFLVAFDNSGIGLTSWEGVTLTGTDQIIAKYTLFGDLNLDGEVNSFDYSVIDSNFGTGNSWLTGDANLDGMVNSFDYSTVDTHFGKSFPMMGGGAGLSIAAIPEPSTFVLGGLAVLGLAGYRLRRRGLKTGAC